MQDRFKFRFWFKDTQEMVYSEKFNDVQTLGQWLFEDRKDVVKMQCTGLRDRHNNLIYEGDIVRFYSLYGHATFEIKWSEEFTTFGYEDDETDFSELGRLYDEAAFVEVFGNIYENKELLNEI